MYVLKSTFITAEFVVKQEYEGELIRKPHCMAFQKEVNDNITLNFREREFIGWKHD